MTLIYLIRHGEPEAGGELAPDPGLTRTGHEQAANAARVLAERGPLPIITSLLRRARETAQAFETVWGQPADVEPRVAEIPSPGMTFIQRSEWLKSLSKRRWRDLDPVVCDWRWQAIERMLDISNDTVVVSHFMVINAVVGWALGEERIVCCHPLQGSCTILEQVGRSLRMMELGAQATPKSLSAL